MDGQLVYTKHSSSVADSGSRVQRIRPHPTPDVTLVLHDKHGKKKETLVLEQIINPIVSRYQKVNLLRHLTENYAAVILLKAAPLSIPEHHFVLCKSI